MIVIAVFMIGIILFYLSSVCTVVIDYKKDVTVRIRVPLFTVTLSNFKDKGDGDSGSKKRERKLSTREVLRRVLSGLVGSEVTVRRLFVGGGGMPERGVLATAVPYGYHIAIGAFIAFLEARVGRLIIPNNAIIFDPDAHAGSEICVSVRTRLWRVLVTVAGIIRDKYG